ncbi:MAG TPA: VOC family protein [Polyangiaceae bacterium]|nr:VOC family protein [Polyangiaceae bacterium]
MLAKSKIMSFAATTDTVRARAFYGDKLGLRVESEDDYAIVFEAGGTMLRVQKVATFEAQPFTVLGWEVSGIEDVVDGLRARGVAFERYAGMNQDERAIWRSPSGARVAWIRDLDGNTLSLTEF